MGPINRTFAVFSREIFSLFNESSNRSPFPFLLTFENIKVFISPKSRFMASLHHPGERAKAPEATETFISVVTRPAASKSQLFRDSAK